MNASPGQPIFAAAAERAVRRLILAAWCRALSRSALPGCGAAIVGWVLLRVAGVRDEAWWALALLGAWLAAAAALAWLRRPEPFTALAAWDRAAGAREMLASAWFFEREGTATAGASLHLARAREQLTQRRERLARDLPIRMAPRVWLAPVLFVAFALSGWLRSPLAQENRGLSAEARERVGVVGRELAERAKIIDPLKSLTDEEKEKLAALRREVEQTAKALERLNTPRELLEDLERRARDAEKLADALRSEETGALSAGFLAELERNADTADLGNALRAGDLGAAAEQARLLWARLGSRKPSLEEQKRLEEALKRALDAANKKDRDSTAGRRLDEARKELSAGNHGGAAQRFDQLSQQLDRAAQRNQAQRQLRNLAQSFRGAGPQIFGGQNLQRLTPQAPLGSQPLAGLPLLTPGSGPPGSPQGLLLVPHSSSGAPNALIPIPGTGAPRGAMPFPIPGSGSKPGNPLPIPGTGQNPGGMPFPIPGMAGAGMPLPGGAASADGGGQGGSEAGRGTAALGADPTKLLDAKQTGMVAPAPGAEGPSEVRAVAGESHGEAPARTRQEIAAEFLKAEEAALAEEPLPLSRREQVLRYFTAIRQQLESKTKD